MDVDVTSEKCATNNQINDGPNAEKRKRSNEDVDVEEASSKKISSDYRVCITNLNCDITAKILEEKLSIFGHVVKCHMPIDKMNAGEEFAIVTFADDEAKCKALQNDGILSVEGQKLVISKMKEMTANDEESKADNEERNHEKENTIYVGKIHPKVVEKDLRDYFTQFGEILKINLPMYGKGAPKAGNKGFGFICFKDANSMQTALTSKSHKISKGKVIIKEAEDRTKSRTVPIREIKRMENEMFVANVSYETDKATLEAHFAKYGKIVNMAMPFNRKSGHHKGYAFIAFENEECVNTVLAEDQKVGDRTLVIRYDEKGADGNKVVRGAPPKYNFSNEIYVMGINPKSTKESLEQYFAKYGHVTNVTFPSDRLSCTSQAYAFIAFETADGMNAALAEKHEIDGSPLSVRLKNTDTSRFVKYVTVKNVEEYNAETKIAEDDKTEKVI